MQIYVVIATRKFSWGEDRRDMFFTAEKGAEMAAEKVREKFSLNDIDGDVTIITRVVQNDSSAEDDEFVHCILH